MIKWKADFERFFGQSLREVTAETIRQRALAESEDDLWAVSLDLAAVNPTVRQALHADEDDDQREEGVVGAASLDAKADKQAIRDVLEELELLLDLDRLALDELNASKWAPMIERLAEKRDQRRLWQAVRGVHRGSRRWPP